MKDRVPANPNRFLITPEDGSPPFYGTLTRADNPLVEGTLLNKETLMSDSAEAAIWGSAADRTVSQALQQMRSLISSAQSTANSAYSKVKMVSGSYTGTGSTQTISLGFSPKFFILKNRDEILYQPSYTKVRNVLCFGFGSKIFALYIEASAYGTGNVVEIRKEVLTTLSSTISFGSTGGYTLGFLCASGAVYDYFAIA